MAKPVLFRMTLISGNEAAFLGFALDKFAKVMRAVAIELDQVAAFEEEIFMKIIPR